MLTKISALAIIALAFAGLTSCNPQKSLTALTQNPLKVDNYGYHPLDPLPVSITTEISREKMLKALPDETMRLAIAQTNSAGGLSFVSAKTGYEHSSYMVVLDYLKFTTRSFEVSLDTASSGRLSALIAPSAGTIVPVYIGVGLRLTANITVLKGEVDLGNLFAIGAAASAGRVTGTLIVQTLGISGELISAALPMPSEINTSTIQNAILALGTIKSNIYDSTTTIVPRVLGVYNTLGGGAETVNAFISALLSKKIEFDPTSNMIPGQ